MKKLITMALAATMSASAFAFDESERWTISGYLDLYYLRSMEDPDGGVVGSRLYDVFHANPSIAEWGVNLKRSAGGGIPVGLTLELFGGRNAVIDNGFEPGGEEYRPIKQAFATWGDPGGKWGIDYGIFTTWIGYESRESIDNANYSRSMQALYVHPTYHHGARAWFNLGENLNVGLAGVRGWNEIEDSNDDYSFGGWLKYEKGPMTAQLNFYSGTEGGDEPSGFFGMSDETDVEMVEGILKYKMNDKFSLGVDVTQLRAEQGGDSGRFTGVALYGSYMMSDKCTLSGRFEMFEDSDGIIFDEGEKINGFTITLDKKVSDHGKVRLEYRSDTADSDIFPGGSGFRDNQATYSISYQVRLKG